MRMSVWSSDVCSSDLVTSDGAAVDADAPRWTALLTPQGKALFDFLIWADGDAVLLDCEAAEAEALAKRLTLYRLRRPLTIEPAGGAVHWAVEGAEGVPDPRSEERRVGKECVRTCSSRWASCN